MFTALENELIHILRANLSEPAVTPPLVPSDRVVNGPIEPPSPGQLPSIAVSADAFESLPVDDPVPPRGTKVLVEERFSSNGSDPLALDKSPLEPLRAVEVDAPVGGRVLLRERDDYTVDYVNRQLRLRRPHDGDVFVQYFALKPLRVIAATRVRVDCHLDIWARSDPSVTDELESLGTIAMGAVGANSAGINGLVTPTHDVVDSGLPSLGTRQAFVVFEELRPSSGRRAASNQWTIRYAVDATLVLVPADDEVTVMRYVATGTSWDEAQIERILAAPSPVLSRPVTVIRDVGSATADALALLGITTVGQLAQLAPTGEAAIDNAVPRAQIVHDRAQEVMRHVVGAAPDISDVAAFLAQPLDQVDVSDLTAVDIPVATADEIVTALGDLLAQTTASDLILSDILIRG